MLTITCDMLSALRVGNNNQGRQRTHSEDTANPYSAIVLGPEGWHIEYRPDRNFDPNLTACTRESLTAISSTARLETPIPPMDMFNPHRVLQLDEDAPKSEMIKSTTIDRYFMKNFRIACEGDRFRQGTSWWIAFNGERNWRNAVAFDYDRIRPIGVTNQPISLDTCDPVQMWVTDAGTYLRRDINDDFYDVLTPEEAFELAYRGRIELHNDTVPTLIKAAVAASNLVDIIAEETDPSKSAFESLAVVSNMVRRKVQPDIRDARKRQVKAMFMEHGSQIKAANELGISQGRISKILKDAMTDQ